MRGKYSPTVSAAYMMDQNWREKYSEGPDGEWNQYDPEGYDSYGYNKDDCDRAGNFEYEYYADDGFGGNYWYDNTLDSWTFDGVKPVEK